MGVCGKDYTQDFTKTVFTECFDRTESRGPDMSRICENGMGILAFHRLAIMDLNETGMQPFSRGGNMLVCNGEIYGFRKIKKELEKKYSFAGDSDCEILLPMYEEYGTDMFSMLDAEFALIIFDGTSGHYIAARDPVGIRPLFYGRTSSGIMIFASEAKNLVGLTERIEPFPPGHYCIDGRFVCYNDISHVSSFSDDGIETVCNKIHDKLIKGIEKRLDADAPIGFLLSGGLDSSLVCSVSAKILGRPIRTFAIGMNEDAIDLKYAREVADFIHSEHREIIIDKDTVISSLEKVISILGTYDITTVRASVGMYLICKAIHETTDVRVLLTGEISDELFGYKYTDYAPSPEAFQEEAVKRISEIYMYDVLRADRCISVNSMEARVPFGDIDFVRYVMSADPRLKINTYGKGKYLLRHAFEDCPEGEYLPRSILFREKAAFSDAVGHSMVDYIKEYADTLYTDEEYEEKRLQYTFAVPFTKESLLYRIIFEKYYPGQAHMVTDFWMPNRSWEGCDVNDPSARVLKNYAGSGI